LKEVAFWDIYYEHCSYFSPGSLAATFRRAYVRLRRPVRPDTRASCGGSHPTSSGGRERSRCYDGRNEFLRTTGHRADRRLEPLHGLHAT
jgi:hypothetical protein